MSELIPLRLHSEAWPEQEPDAIYSNVHHILNSSQIQIDKANIKYRLLHKTDIEPLKCLHKEWFPVNYSDDYFDPIGKESRYIAIGAFYPYLNKNLLLGAIFSNLEFDDSISNYVYKRSLLTKILRGLNCCHTPDLLMYIMTIGVIDEVRRMGIGSALIDQCAKVAKERMPLCKGISLQIGRAHV